MHHSHVLFATHASKGAICSHMDASTSRAVCFPFNTLLVKLMGLLAKLHSHWPERNKKLPHVKMKVHWQGLPSVSYQEQQTETSLLSSLSYTYFSPTLLYFQSWQPHKSTIQMDCTEDAEHHEWGISCPPGPFPFVLSLSMYY